MRLRNKIIISFSIAFTVVLGVALTSVYFFISINREEEFLQRLKDRTTSTFRLLLHVKEIDHNLLQVVDRNTINTLYDEKILMFDSTGHNIYSSVDDTKILFPLEIINQLKQGEDELFYREGDYEVYAHSITDNGHTFYAMGKAYDKYGESELSYMAWALFAIFIVVLVLVVSISYFLSKQITEPIDKLTAEVNSRNIDNLARIEVPATRDEITLLAAGFNEMLARVEQSYVYQKNFIQHMSHELKTPIAVLISNIERALTDYDADAWRNSFEFQRNGLMQMASVVNTLLDISRYETNPDQVNVQAVRIDELIFECFESLQLVYPDARFMLAIQDGFEDTEELAIPGNERMLHIALFNLVKNAADYSDDQHVTVDILKSGNSLIVEIRNNGATLSESDQDRLFEHFFRGSNSRVKTGIGLGLVLSNKIIQLHKGSLTYSISAAGKNLFTVILQRP